MRESEVACRVSLEGDWQCELSERSPRAVGPFRDLSDWLIKTQSTTITNDTKDRLLLFVMSINGLGYTPSTGTSQETSAAGAGKVAKPEGETIRVQVEFGSVHRSRSLSSGGGVLL